MQSFSMGGMGGGNQSGSPDGAKRAAKQEDTQTCIAVTVRTIETAIAKRADSGDEIRIYGAEPGMLMLVACVETLTRQTTSLELTINDGTGRLKARYYFSDPTPEGLDQIQAGVYVSVVGSLRTAPMVHLGVQCLRAIDSPDAISYHMIEAAHVALKLQKGGFEPTTPLRTSPSLAADAVKDKFSPPKDVEMAADEPPAPILSAATPAREKAAGLEGPRLREAVINFLQKVASSDATRETGATVNELAAHLGSSTSSTEVKTCIDQLLEDGEAISTIDDEHFAIMN